MIGATDRFRRSDRVRASRDFVRIGRVGKRFVSRYFVLLVGQGQAARGRPLKRRLGVTVSRAVGNAVVRNRVKRAIREWYRQSQAELEHVGKVDLVVIARPGAGGLRGLRSGEELGLLAARAEV